MPEQLITAEEIETLELVKTLPLETDEDYRKLAEIFDGD